MNIADEKITTRLPGYVTAVMERFFEAGEDVYVVGGSLRDIMLDTEPHDFDLATSALPERTAELFSDMRVIETGLQHGTVTVISEGRPIEITTFRVDGSYSDKRRPDSVSFTAHVEEDLSRRDFTVNAMAFNRKRGLVDPFGGREDLEKGILRAVGEGERRFTEDALRIMRAFRFSAQLGFEIEEKTLLAAAAKRDGLCFIARERIAAELLKLLSSSAPERALRLMIQTGTLSLITGGYIPENTVLEKLKYMPDEDFARLGFFLSSAETERAREIINSLKCSNKQKTGALAVVKGAHTRVTGDSEARRFVSGYGVYAPYVIRAAELLGYADGKTVRSVCENRSPCTISSLAVSGRDLMEIGISGRSVGETLNTLLERVLEDPSLNEREILLSIAKKINK